MEIKCPCEHCGVNIEFAFDSFVERGRNDTKIIGQEVQCPTCSKNTILHILNKDKANKQDDQKIERSLELIGNVVLFLGVLSLVGGFFIMLLAGYSDVTNKGELALDGLLIAVVGFAQGFVLQALFRALAEMIRLLRRIAAK